MRFTQQGSGLYTPPPPVIGQLIYDSGASNTWGPNAGQTGVTSGALYWDTDATPGGSGITSTFWHNLHGTGVHISHGPGRSLAGGLIGQPGYEALALMTIACGSSLYTDWQIGDPKYNAVKAATQAALALLPAAFPQVTSWQIRQIRNQGSSDMRVNNLAYQQGWAAGQASWTTALKNDIFSVWSGVPHTWKPDLLIQQCTDITGAFFVSQGVIPQQYIYTDADHVVNCDPSQGVAYEADFVHYTMPGNITVGGLVSARAVFLDSIGQ